MHSLIFSRLGGKVGRFIFFLFFLFISKPAFLQLWPKIYSQSTNSWCNNLIEYYDKGYLIVGQVDPGNNVPTMYCWLIKTDINGNVIWDKKMFSPLYYTAMNGIDQTPDGGLILTGVTTRLDSNDYDVVFIKLNCCGEKEWCNIISTPGNSDFGLKIKTIPGGYIALVKYFEDWMTKRIWLFKLNESGNIIWEKLYAKSDSNIFDEEGRDILISSDGGYLITGDCAYLVPGGSYGIERPLMIKSDSNGNEVWVLPFGLICGYSGDLSGYPYENPSHNYYATARHFRSSFPYGDSPGFIKISQNGNELYYKDLFNNTIGGLTTTLKFINLNRIVLSCSWTFNPNGNTDSVGLIKCDTLGYVKKIKILLQNGSNNLLASTTTFDNHFITSGGFSVTNPFHSNIYLYKVDTNLEFAVNYTKSITYDSLCPHPIVSDTMNLDDCGVITKVHDPILEPEFYNLKIYPNPSSEKITIVLPDLLLKKSTTGPFNVSTIYHQWNTTILEIYDLFGKLMYSKEIPKKTEKVELDVSTWHEGMYVARVVFMNEVVAGAKFVVQ